MTLPLLLLIPSRVERAQPGMLGIRPPLRQGALPGHPAPIAGSARVARASTRQHLLPTNRNRRRPPADSPAAAPTAPGPGSSRPRVAGPRPSNGGGEQTRYANAGSDPPPVRPDLRDSRAARRRENLAGQRKGRGEAASSSCREDQAVVTGESGRGRAAVWRQHGQCGDSVRAQGRGTTNGRAGASAPCLLVSPSRGLGIGPLQPDRRGILRTFVSARWRAIREKHGALRGSPRRGGGKGSGPSSGVLPESVGEVVRVSVMSEEASDARGVHLRRDRSCLRLSRGPTGLGLPLRERRADCLTPLPPRGGIFRALRSVAAG